MKNNFFEINFRRSFRTLPNNSLAKYELQTRRFQLDPLIQTAALSEPSMNSLRALAIESQVTVTARTRAHENPKCYSALYETAARSAAKICYRALCEMTARSAKICTILHEVVGYYSKKLLLKHQGNSMNPPQQIPLTGSGTRDGT